MTRRTRRVAIWLLVLAVAALVVPLWSWHSELGTVPTADSAPCGSAVQSWFYPAKPTDDQHAPWLTWDDYGITNLADKVWKNECQSDFAVATTVSVTSGSLSLLTFAFLFGVYRGSRPGNAKSGRNGKSTSTKVGELIE
jgi:hypothetical protein